MCPFKNLDNDFLTPRFLTVFKPSTLFVKCFDFMPPQVQKNNAKGALSGVRQYVASKSLLKMMKNAFISP